MHAECNYAPSKRVVRGEGRRYEYAIIAPDGHWTVQTA